MPKWQCPCRLHQPPALVHQLLCQLLCPLFHQSHLPL